MLLSAAKCQGYSIYHFFVIKGKPTVVGVKLPPSPTQIRVKANESEIAVCVWLYYTKFEDKIRTKRHWNMQQSMQIILKGKE